MLLGVFDGINNFFETMGVQLIQCIAVFVVGLLAIKIVKGIIKKVTRKSKSQTLINFFVSCLTAFLYLFIFYIIFSILGISTTSFIAVLSAAGLAIALSLKDSLSNLANGVIIVTTKPFVEGDFVNIGGVEGNIKSVNMFTTIILTKDNKEITIPNSKVISGEIINYSAKTTRRIDIDVGVAYESDLEFVKKVLMEVLQNNSMIAKTPEPYVRLEAFGDSALIVKVRGWTSNDNYTNCRIDLLEQILDALNKNKIKIPYPTRELYVVKPTNNDGEKVGEENEAN